MLLTAIKRKLNILVNTMVNLIIITFISLWIQRVRASSFFWERLFLTDSYYSYYSLDWNICTWICVCYSYTHMCDACTNTGRRSIALDPSPPSTLETGSATEPAATFPPKHSSYRHICSQTRLFTWMLVIWTQVLTLAQQQVHLTCWVISPALTKEVSLNANQVSVYLEKQEFSLENQITVIHWLMMGHPSRHTRFLSFALMEYSRESPLREKEVILPRISRHSPSGQESQCRRRLKWQIISLLWSENREG